MPQQLAGGFAEGQFSHSLTKIWNYHENTALSVPVKDFPQKTLREWELAPFHGLEFQTAWKAEVTKCRHSSISASWWRCRMGSCLRLQPPCFPHSDGLESPVVSPNKPFFSPAASPEHFIAAMQKVKKTGSKGIWFTFFKIIGKGRREMAGKRRLVSSWSRPCEA